MAKQTGLGAGLFLNGLNLSGDTQSVDIGKTAKSILQTGIDVFAPERAASQLDSELNWVSYFNPSRAHTELKKPPTNDVVGLYVTKMASIGAHAAGFVGMKTTYGFTRGNDGALTAKVNIPQTTNWLDWGLMLTAGQRTDTTGTNGTGVDFNNWGGGSAHGLQFYVQSVSVTGTSTTYKLQHSSDNGVGDPWADISGATQTFTAAATTRAGRVAVTGTIKRYLRLVTSGTFTNTVFAAMACVNVTDVSSI